MSILILLLTIINFRIDLIINWYPNIFEITEIINLNILIDWHVLLFLSIVVLVTCFVLIYREIYIEHYNNKKFFSSLLFFFSSMVILILGGSNLLLIVGWDWLGLSSIILIMFYPNNNTLYNSILTIFFNRLGDVILISLVSLIILNFFNNFFVFRNEIIFKEKFFPLIILLIITCSFTKRAQFPLSSWLPAAMSAPTPISAIVHSSTLVTAGVFLNHKICFYYETVGLLQFVFMIRITTFLIGGFLANLEKDFKKIVAFSTIRQISIVMMFCSIIIIIVRFSHMFLHAIFKTLLFSCAGIYFVKKFRDQFITKFSSYESTLKLKSLFILSLFIISGLTYSCSFFTKDLFIEFFIFSDMFDQSLLLFLGSFLTLFYRCKLMYYSNLNFTLTPWFKQKIFRFKFLIAFFIILLTSGKIYRLIFCFQFSTVGFYFLVFLINSLFFLSLRLKLKIKRQFFLELTKNILEIKNFTFSLVSQIFLKTKLFQIFESDVLFFKNKNLIFNNIITENSNWLQIQKSIYFVTILLILKFLIYSFSLLRT